MSRDDDDEDDDDGVNLALVGGALGRLSARQVIPSKAALPTLRPPTTIPPTLQIQLCNPK